MNRRVAWALHAKLQQLSLHPLAMPPYLARTGLPGEPRDDASDLTPHPTAYPTTTSARCGVQFSTHLHHHSATPDQLISALVSLVPLLGISCLHNIPADPSGSASQLEEDDKRVECRSEPASYEPSTNMRRCVSESRRHHRCTGTGVSDEGEAVARRREVIVPIVPPTSCLQDLHARVMFGAAQLAAGQLTGYPLMSVYAELCGYTSTRLIDGPGTA